VRTVIAALHPRVQGQLMALDAKRAAVARRYVARLAIEPTSVIAWTVAFWAQSSAGPSTSITTAGLMTCSAPGDRPEAAVTICRRARPTVSSTGCWRRGARGCASCRCWGLGRGHVAPGEEDVYAAAAQLLQVLNRRTK
jgi:hypothetical protein